MIETLQIRSTTQADRKYSVLISIPPPLNVILLFFAPFLVSTTNPQKINERMLKVAYIPVLVFVTIVFGLGEMLMWPFVYIKIVFHKLTMVYVYSKSFRVSRADKFVHFLFFLFCGPVIIPGNSIIDLIYFVKHLTLKELRKLKHKIRHKTISKKSFEILQNYFDER